MRPVPAPPSTSRLMGHPVAPPGGLQLVPDPSTLSVACPTPGLGERGVACRSPFAAAPFPFVSFFSFAPLVPSLPCLSGGL
eukprot:5775469-Heterocapsa_arctica.AAC.1